MNKNLKRILLLIFLLLPSMVYFLLIDVVQGFDKSLLMFQSIPTSYDTQLVVKIETGTTVETMYDIRVLNDYLLESEYLNIIEYNTGKGMPLFVSLFRVDENNANVGLEIAYDSELVVLDEPKLLVSKTISYLSSKIEQEIQVIDEMEIQEPGPQKGVLRNNWEKFVVYIGYFFVIIIISLIKRNRGFLRTASIVGSVTVLLICVDLFLMAGLVNPRFYVHEPAWQYVRFTQTLEELNTRDSQQVSKYGWKRYPESIEFIDAVLQYPDDYKEKYLWWGDQDYYFDEIEKSFVMVLDKQSHLNINSHKRQFYKDLDPEIKTYYENQFDRALAIFLAACEKDGVQLDAVSTLEIEENYPNTPILSLRKTILFCIIFTVILALTFWTKQKK